MSDTPTPSTTPPGTATAQAVPPPAVPAADVPPDPGQLTPEEQMALFEKELKETDWGHQPC